MRTLHLVQGGISNGDQAWLEKAARDGRNAKRWVVPKGVAVGDDVIIFIRGIGFFASARIKTPPFLRLDWANRYGAGLCGIKLIEPAVSVAVIRRTIPDLIWANYPRSITTPTPAIAEQVRELIRERRKVGAAQLEESDLSGANLDELRAAALLKRLPATASIKERLRREYLRSRSIHAYVLGRANGACEGCSSLAPFVKADNTPYLEPHHTTRMADDGPDHPAHVIALCPNCHRRAHSSKDAEDFNAKLIERLARIEPVGER